MGRFSGTGEPAGAGCGQGAGTDLTRVYPPGPRAGSENASVSQHGVGRPARSPAVEGRAPAACSGVAELSADRAYSSYASLECVEDAGGTPYIAFKVNSRGENRPGIWEKMHAHFTLRRDDFLTHYHERSNVESTFSMMKRKFRDAVRSKTEVAIRNEVLAKVLCHNLVVCVHEMHELGIDPDGFGSPPKGGPKVIRFPR
ncbi:MAG TPA: transposase [Urbifossiella sp.]|nr:transposase [Urbifossiella sp.]